MQLSLDTLKGVLGLRQIQQVEDHTLVGSQELTAIIQQDGEK